MCSSSRERMVMLFGESEGLSEKYSQLSSKSRKSTFSIYFKSYCGELVKMKHRFSFSSGKARV